MLGKIAVGAAVFIAAVWAWNTSLLATVPDVGGAKLLSHRGVHQTFGSQDLQSETCTAERIFPPTHDYIENTLPSMRAAGSWSI